MAFGSCHLCNGAWCGGWAPEMECGYVPECHVQACVLSLFSSVQSLSRVRLFATPWTAAHQASLSITNSQSLFKLMSIESVMPSNHLTLSSPSPPAFNLSQHQALYKWVNSLHQVAKVLEFQLQHQSFQWIFRTNFLYNWLIWSPCSPRDCEESSPTPQFKSINYSAFSFLYGPTLTSIHDYWEKYSYPCYLITIVEVEKAQDGK